MMINNEKNQNQNILNIYFEDTFRRKVFLKCNINEYLSSLFRKYIQSTKKYNQNLIFLFNGSTLNYKNKLSQIGIRNGEKITVVDNGNLKGGGGGGFSLKFSDLSKQIYEEMGFSDDAPIYRYVGNGINICGECKFENCVAYNLEVIVPLNQIRKFNLVKERENLKCPLCKSLINPKTVAFYLCGYKVKGKNYENDVIKSFEFYGKADKENVVQYYSPIKNGETLVIELIIEIINYF